MVCEDIRRIFAHVASIISDRDAHKTLDACHLAHLMVPNQVNIIGVDNNTELCENVLPTLSSVQPEFERSGYLAAEALYAFLKGRKPRKRLVFGVQTVVERNSTRDLRGGRLLVSRATDIIRSRFTDSAFRAEHLAAKLKVSRQLLDLRPRKTGAWREGRRLSDDLRPGAADAALVEHDVSRLNRGGELLV